MGGGVGGGVGGGGRGGGEGRGEGKRLEGREGEVAGGWEGN